MPAPDLGGPTITDEQHNGQQGQRVVGVLVGEMKHEWHEAGRNEAGIDGVIELREPGSRQVNAQILLCQVKAGDSYIQNETAESFTWKPDPSDLVYWENANAPVIVVIVRLSTPMKAWWVAIDEAFPDADARATRAIRFDKRRDLLNGAPNSAFWDVARRERERRAVATRTILAGPYAAVGLRDDYEEAQRATDETRWGDAATLWGALADVARAKNLVPRLVRPAEEQRARALEQGGRRPDAGRLWARLASEQVDDDDPDAAFNLQRALFYGVPADDFDVALTHVRAELPEAGVDALDDLRVVFRMADNAAHRQAAGAALVDALLFFGVFDEAERITGRLLGKRHDTLHKRWLALDGLDAASELGQDVAAEWEALLQAWRPYGPEVFAVALQRRAIAHLRADNADEAREAFERAAETWSLVEGGDEQVAEAALSASLVDDMAGQIAPSRMPVGARQAAALARGDIRTPVTRSDRLVTAGLGYLADDNHPDALKRLTLAAMIDRRAGNLFSYRRSSYLLARAYERADEWAEALRFWLMLGSETRAAALSPRLEAADLLGMLRLEDGPPWQRSAGFATLAAKAPELDATAVAAVARVVITAASPLYTLVAPHPSYHARHVLARIGDRLPKRLGPAAGAILSEDVELGSPLARDASKGLVELYQRGAFDSMPVLMAAVLRGDDLPVTVRGWLHSASKAEQRPVVAAARKGNRIALEEAAAADLPQMYPDLRRGCEAAVRASIRGENNATGQSFGVSFTNLADMARFCSPRTQGQFVSMLLRVIDGSAYDNVSKISALTTMAIIAKGLATTPAKRALDTLLPVACGRPVVSAPSELTDHRNPKRARSRITYTTPPKGVRAAAVQACAALHVRTKTRTSAVADMLADALSEDDPQTLRLALSWLAEMPALVPEADPARWIAHPAADVASAAKRLLHARRDSPVSQRP